MLLSLQQEVQSLKFLNGGALSDLVASVSRIKQNALTAPNYNNPVLLWSKNGGGSANPLIPDYVPKTDATLRIGDVPQTGWLYVSILLNQSSGASYPAKVRFYLNDRNMTSTTAAIGTIGSISNLFPTSVGDRMSLCIIADDAATINASSYWISATLYPNKTL